MTFTLPDSGCHFFRSPFYSLNAYIYSLLGLALGILVHVTYSLVGIGLIISKSILLFSVIKLLGAAYLIYIGYKSLQAKPDTELKQQFRSKQDISKIAAIRIGFISNVLNPKVTLFFLSLFTQVINFYTPVVIQIWYGLQMFIMTFAWYTIVAIVMSHSVDQKTRRNAVTQAVIVELMYYSSRVESEFSIINSYL